MSCFFSFVDTQAVGYENTVELEKMYTVSLKCMKIVPKYEIINAMQIKVV